MLVFTNPYFWLTFSQISFHPSSSFPTVILFPPRTNGKRNSFGSFSIRASNSPSDTRRYFSPAASNSLPSRSNKPYKVYFSMKRLISPGDIGFTFKST